MCGICGKLIFDKQSMVRQSLIQAMLHTIRHRGPDDEGVYVSKQIGLGHRRLSIIDLNTGRQPLCNEDGTVWIVFNGEIYNYQELREYLLAEGHVFKTQTDTEVIVHLYEEFGESCVEKLRGMFAFALWDDRQKALFLARDRVGIKPLYYCLSESSFMFASEIKAILADPEVKPEVLPAMIGRFLTFDYVPGRETLIRNIYKLEPGFSMMIREGKAELRQYWDLHFRRSTQSIGQAEAELLGLLEESVRLHMISDVPVGFLLSGGVDSTAMLSFAAGKTTQPLSSYTLGFSESGIVDERPYARLAARAYGTEHHEMTITSQDFADFLPMYVWHMEEPVCEPPAISLYYVSKLAKEFVKVLISGEGGDEAFAGYSDYRNILWMERFKSVTSPFNGILSAIVSFVNRRFLQSQRVAKYASLLKTPFESYYYSRTSSPSRFFNNHIEGVYSKDFTECLNHEYSVGTVMKYIGNGAHGDMVNRMLYVDTKTWLPDDLLLKADKMTMANSVELRVPLLDHKLLEFAASLSGNYKVRGVTTKYIAKRVLNKRVPREILERKKVGFPVPYESWLRTELRDWLLGILLDRETLNRGYFERKAIETLISKDLQSAGYSKELFKLATLELWHRAFLQKQEAFV